MTLFLCIVPIIHLQQKFDLNKLYKEHPKLKKIGSDGREEG